MSLSIMRRNSCRLCDSTHVELVVKLNPVPLAEKYTDSLEEAKSAAKYPIDLHMCRQCGHVQLLDVIDSQRLWNDYTYHSGQTQGIIRHFEQISQKILVEFSPPPGSLIIDVGSNDGTLLRFFKNTGYRVLGIDPATEIAQKATAAGIETIPTTLTSQTAKDVHQSYGSASIVTAFNVFAHADDLANMTEGICSLLDKDGLFVFEVQYLLDIIDNMLIGTIFHEHMSHHSLKPMIRFLNRYGMEIIDVERVPIQKGSLIGIAQRHGGYRKVNPSVPKLLQLEEQRNLDRPQAMEPFNKRLEKNRKLIHTLITDWKREKLIIAGYGAARSGPTLIEQFGLTDIMQYIFDDHAQKINRFYPGIGLRVIPTAELNQKKPDIVIILAWIHARSIIENNKRYLQEGGKFVVCCPDVRVIDSKNPF